MTTASNLIPNEFEPQDCKNNQNAFFEDQHFNLKIWHKSSIISTLKIICEF